MKWGKWVMKSQMSLLNRNLLGHFTGLIFWMTVVYMVMNIIALPLIIWIDTMNNNMIVGGTVRSSLLELSAGQQIIGLAFSTLVGMFLINYLYKVDSSDFIHSLPIKRSNLLIHVLIVGFLAIVIPLLVNGLILVAESMTIATNITLLEIGKWLVYSIFTHLVMFSIALFTGYLVNGSFLHLQIIILILFLPIVLWTLIHGTASLLFDGISTDITAYIQPVLDATFPILAVNQLYMGLNVGLSLIFGILAIILIILSFVLYKYRRNESVHLSFNFTLLRNLLIALTTITGMLALGVVVSFLLQQSVIISIISFSVGALVSYLVIEMLFQNSVKIQFHWRSLILTIVLIIIFWIIFVFAFTRYVEDIPETNEIESVSLNNDAMMMDQASRKYLEAGYGFDDSKGAIQTARTIHEIASEERSRPDFSKEMEATINVQYKMKDGSIKTYQFNTLNSDSEAVQLMDRQRFSEYQKHDDVLAYAQQTPKLIGISSNEYNVDLDKDIVDSYKASLAELSLYHSVIVNETGQIGLNLNYVDDSIYGTSSIYNPAITENVENKDEVLSLLGIDKTSVLYTVNLEENEYEAFVTDYETLTVDELDKKYELKEVDGNDFVTDFSKQDIDPTSGKLLLYSYPGFIEDPQAEYETYMNYSLLSIR